MLDRSCFLSGKAHASDFIRDAIQSKDCPCLFFHAMLFREYRHKVYVNHDSIASKVVVMRVPLPNMCWCFAPCMPFAQESTVEPKTRPELNFAKTPFVELTGFELVDGQEVTLECAGQVYVFAEPIFEMASGTRRGWIQKGAQEPAAVLSLATVDVRRFYKSHFFSDNPLKVSVRGSTRKRSAACTELNSPMIQLTPIFTSIEKPKRTKLSFQVELAMEFCLESHYAVGLQTFGAVPN